ncbi:MAG: hypothetical protein APR63_05525 [Desulfuromonas sp. SDB]|nr:MAG: hypothetical protein APR63_05525 [Desulfuromonas sp. SDB]
MNNKLPIYLNNAATSFPKPNILGKEIAEHISEIPRHPGRIGSADMVNKLQLCRKAIARLININNPNQIVLCKNATEGLNIVIHGLKLQKSDTVITSSLEHNSVLRPLFLIRKTKKFKLVILPCNTEGRIIKEDWQRVLDQYKPKVVIMNHASNVTGAVNDISFLFKQAKQKHCITVLDTSQTLGLIDVDVNNLFADIIVFTGHKYLLGPTGTGGVYINKNIDIQPVFVGGTGIKSDLLEMPPEMPVKLEPGTPNIALFAGLIKTINWQKENPVNLEKFLSLTNRLSEKLSENGMNTIKVKGERTGIVSFFSKKWSVDEIGYILNKNYNIICRTGLHCAPLIHKYLKTYPKGTVRFSLSRFTTEEEINLVVEAMKAFQ